METHRVQLEVVLLLIFINLVLTQQQVNVSLSSKSDRSALFQLRSSLGLRARDWPRKSDPCSWAGVGCRTGRVIGINVSGLKRTRLGQLNPRFAVDSLANFTRLTHFNASGFLLPGPIPDWFGQKLAALQVLDLRSCSITGTIPSSFGNLSVLEYIDMSNNMITGNIPSTLGLLSSLSRLNLSFNFLSGAIPSSLGSLSSLKFLNLYNNSLYGSIPVQLGNLSQLIKLDLGQNDLSGSLSNTSFMNLTQLEYVGLSWNSFAGDFPDVLWSLPRLRFLDISGNNFTGVLPNVPPLFNVSSSSFNFSNNMFLGNLTPVVTEFRSIDLSGNYFKGPGPSNVGTNVVIARNCLQSIPNQRTLNDCELFYASRGLTFGDEKAPVPAPSALLEPASNNRRRLMFILAGVFGGLGFIVIMVLVLVLLLKKYGKGNIDQRTVSTGTVPGGQTPPPKACINLSGLGESFTYEQMVQATGDFSDTNLIKHGHSGDIFHGTLEGGFHVVIKRVDLNSCRKDSYTLELDFFCKASHPRLVPLLGHCLEHENEKLLVYKYMPHGDLSNSLYKLTDLEDDSLQSLDWITRMKIAIGAAEGLSYLHHECNPPIVHRDIQASSILLDDKYEVRLGSLSEVFAQGGDTHQNMITKLLRMPQTSEQGPSGPSSATCAYDVYCFGKVLLELVTGKLGISKSDDVNTKEWLEQNLPSISINKKDMVAKIVDQSLIVDEDLLEEVWAMAIVAKSCLNPKPSKRPLMRHVLRALENPLKVVREESSSSGGLKTSSRRSWSTALFGSWRHSSSGSGNGPGQTNREGVSGLKHSSGVGSQGSGGNEHSSNSHKRLSSEIFPEPVDMQDLERQNEN